MSSGLFLASEEPAELNERRYWYVAVIHAFALTPESLPGESVERRCESMKEGESTEAGADENTLAEMTNKEDRYE